MPITRKQFDMGIDQKTEEWMDKIRTFLTEHKDEAFTIEELRKYYAGILTERLSDGQKKLLQSAAYNDAFDIFHDEKSGFDSALEKLVAISDVQEKKIRGDYYYSNYIS